MNTGYAGYAIYQTNGVVLYRRPYPQPCYPRIPDSMSSDLALIHSSKFSTSNFSISIQSIPECTQLGDEQVYKHFFKTCMSHIFRQFGVESCLVIRATIGTHGDLRNFVNLVSIDRAEKGGLPSKKKAR
jgi:hypothetical protein